MQRADGTNFAVLALYVENAEKPQKTKVYWFNAYFNDVELTSLEPTVFSQTGAAGSLVAKEKGENKKLFVVKENLSVNGRWGIDGKPGNWSLFMKEGKGTVVLYDLGQDEKPVITRYVTLVAAPIGTYRDAVAELKRAHKRANTGGGFWNTIGTIAQGAVAAMNDYNSVLAGGSASAWANGPENPLDPNSAQSRAFQQSLQQLAQRARDDMAAASSGSAAASTPPSGLSVQSQPAAVPQPTLASTALPAQEEVATRYFDCVSIRRGRREDGSDYIVSAQYGIVTSKRDRDEVWAEFARRTAPTKAINVEASSGTCTPLGTLADAQASQQQVLANERSGGYEKITGIDFTLKLGRLRGTS